MLIEANGRRLWVDVRGSGPPLALLPGGPGVAADYLDDVAARVDHAMTLILINPRGCGRSDHLGPYDVADLIADVDAVRVALRHDRWVIGGHSFGADLALAHALEHPDRTQGVVSISPTGLQDDRAWHRAYEEGQAAGLDQFPDPPPALDEEMHVAAMESWRRYIKDPALLRRVAELSMPYLAILGGDDIRRPGRPSRSQRSSPGDVSRSSRAPGTSRGGRIRIALRERS